ncbi:Metallo-dependent phosphatase [Patellaria atrata CBS 101060]|uniref:Metallo-dependent phosphatase n=1 Tax=Patellaria atrata CBS 101060 TaxID=1346257 RepID=A0A9P4SI21_9PEZI|nr:Metallo-dependent phosphatase [Patellaria atrata CBS 101060]
MKLYAIADIHLSYQSNREAWAELKEFPDDGLIIAGDIGESAAQLETAFEKATSCFRHVFWCPGNHELYTLGSVTDLKGEEKYNECVEIARKYGVHNPEDDFFRWEGEGGPVLIAPIFTLYDYSFRPDHVSRENALSWAEEEDIVATDEAVLHPDPHPSRDAWCSHLVSKFSSKLAAAQEEHGIPLVIINHWPLREDLVYIPRIPRFSLWCGTKETHEWHRRFNVKVVVSGHLHVRRTDWKDGVRFEEVSLGYPRQWKDVRDSGLDVNSLLREILPGPKPPPEGESPTQWRRWG